jgi:hypothetical protein
MALSHIGSRSKIESLTEASTEAWQCKQWYEFSRLQALEMFNWNFAKKRITLSAHSEDPPDGIWAFRYSYPSDCVVAREIENIIGPDADAHPFKVEMASDGESKSILTNIEDANLICTFDQANPNMYTSFFVMLLSWVLASNIGFSLTGKQSVVDRALGNVLNLQVMAPAMNANEEVDKPPRDADWIRARQGVRRAPDARILRSS